MKRRNRVALPNTDAETVSLATNPDFLALIARSRRRAGRKGGGTLQSKPLLMRRDG